MFSTEEILKIVDAFCDPVMNNGKWADVSQIYGCAEPSWGDPPDSVFLVSDWTDHPLRSILSIDDLDRIGHKFAWSDDLFICTGCGRGVHHTYYETYDGEYLCRDCFDDNIDNFIQEWIKDTWCACICETLWDVSNIQTNLHMRDWIQFHTMSDNYDVRAELKRHGIDSMDLLNYDGIWIRRKDQIIVQMMGKEHQWI